ncbi:nitroreductase family protein [Rubinisphaera margarita]|uniref:nitroreductase family protein n=1 Tax=Rubinisphaera margarita TaxID=2909586 RepID=UPI001EE8B66B|nr:nitroreductase family protein [Rubinisphaera margarita]MCG6155117.1 nitroreductase family protein [Rubinisphaera margarita]
MTSHPDPLQVRKADHPIEELFLRRWSPRAMSGESLPEAQLLSLFEAARWAPSTYNEQEWRFLYAHRDSKHWATFFNLLLEANQTWCRNAAVLVLVVSHKVFARNGKPNPVHTFDAGAAFENLCLQGAAMDLVVHGMAGFNRGNARRELKVPDDYEVEAMIAIGQAGDPEQLPEELQAREAPSGRKPVGEIICDGPFSF